MFRVCRIPPLRTAAARLGTRTAGRAIGDPVAARKCGLATEGGAGWRCVFQRFRPVPTVRWGAAHASAVDPAAAVDQVIDRLERQIKKLKGRRVDRTQHAEGVKAMIPSAQPPETHETGEQLFARYKRIEMKPMTPEEAIEQMELLGHDFFLFSNAETQQANVVYRRRNGGYGLIEPEV